MKCPHCGEEINFHPPKELPDILYIAVREKKIGFTGKINPEQLRYFAALDAVFTTIEGVLKNTPLVGDDAIFECKKLGTREGLKCQSSSKDQSTPNG